MPDDPRITYFPVGNGDCSLIELSDETQIVIDCNLPEASQDEGDATRYDVHGHLLRVCKRLDGYKPHVNAFILTHGDEDHCRGFKSGFYTGDPAKYSKWHADRGYILIDELWFSPRIFHPFEEEGLCGDAQAFRKEAERRMALHRGRSAKADRAGNRIRIIGYTDNPDLQELLHLVTVPGSAIDAIDGEPKADFSFFVHGPFKEDSDDPEGDRNSTSVVLQARFDVGGARRAGLAFFGGDADHAIFENIVHRSQPDTLEWDLLLAVHHCSWSFFGPESDDPVPAATSMTFLGHHREGASIVASCKPIRDDDDNPPHWAAAEIYRETVGKENFVELAEATDFGAPRPVTFIATRNGFMPEKALETSRTAISSIFNPSILRAKAAAEPKAPIRKEGGGRYG